MSSMSESTAPSVSYVKETYNSLKEKIAAIKEAQGEHQNKAQKRYENLALLQAQLEHEQIEQAQQEKIGSLKAHLATVIDRTTRIRNAYEKEKKHLNGQVEKLSRDRVHMERDHAAELASLQDAHTAQVSAIAADKKQLQEQLEEALQRIKDGKVDAAKQQMKLYEQYQKDLRAAAEEHEQQLARERAAVQAAESDLTISRAETDKACSLVEAERRRNEDLKAQLSEMIAQLERAAARERHLKEEFRALQGDIDQVKRESDAELQASAIAAEERLEDFKRKKVLEMEQIHDKLQAVLDKKNATISQLRLSLEAAHARLAAHERDVRKQKLQLLESLR